MHLLFQGVFNSLAHFLEQSTIKNDQPTISMLLNLETYSVRSAHNRQKKAKNILDVNLHNLKKKLIL